MSTTTNLVKWEVFYEIPDCGPKAVMTTFTDKVDVIDAPEDREQAKKVAGAYLGAMKNGARGTGLRRKM